MKVGNSAHAAILAIVALGALGFLVARLLPPGHRAVKAKAGSSTAGSASGDAAQLLPTEVTRDAFAHPRLTERYNKSVLQPISSSQAPATPGEVAASDAANSGGVPEAQPNGMRGPLGGQGQADSDRKPRENTGANRPIKKETAPVGFQVKAVLRATTPMALIAINGKKEQMMGLGDTVGDSYKITGITEDAVQLVSGKKRLVVHVGQTGVAK